MRKRLIKAAAVAGIAGTIILAATVGWSKVGNFIRLNWNGNSSVQARDNQDKSVSAVSLTADELVTQGRGLLAANDIVGANQKFALALKTNKLNKDANFFYAITRIPALYQGPALANSTNTGTLCGLLKAFGYQGTFDLFHFNAAMQRDALGHTYFPASSPSPAKVTSFLVKKVVKEIDGALANLAVLTPDYTVTLTPAETKAVDSILIDAGDIAMYKSILDLTKSTILISAAYNTDIKPYDLYNAKVAKGYLSIQNDILNPKKKFMTVAKASSLVTAKAALHNSITDYIYASDYIRNVRPPDHIGDLVTFDPSFLSEEEFFRGKLSELDSSLNASTYFVFPSSHGFNDLNLNLSKMFSATPVSPRSLLPAFDPITNQVMPGTLPDKKFGGILPGYWISLFKETNGFSNSAGSEYLVRVKVTDMISKPMAGLTVTLSFDNGDPDLTLYDDGTQGDETANDGVYSNAHWSSATAGHVNLTYTATDGASPDAHAWQGGDIIGSI